MPMVVAAVVKKRTSHFWCSVHAHSDFSVTMPSSFAMVKVVGSNDDDDDDDDDDMCLFPWFGMMAVMSEVCHGNDHDFYNFNMISFQCLYANVCTLLNCPCV